MAVLARFVGRREFRLATVQRRCGEGTATLEEMAAAERAAPGGRADGLAAVRDYFYRGPIAEKIAAFERDEGGLMTADDLAGYTGGWEEPVTGRAYGYTFHTNGTWSQGLTTPLALKILDTIDLAPLGHNSPRYVHPTCSPRPWCRFS